MWGGLGLPLRAALILARRSGSPALADAFATFSSWAGSMPYSCRNRVVPGVVAPTPRALRHFKTVS
jgi:hypothetical protein